MGIFVEFEYSKIQMMMAKTIETIETIETIATIETIETPPKIDANPLPFYFPS